MKEEKIAIIKTPKGEIHGLDDGESCRFLGVRYASAERFCPARQVPFGEGVVQATAMGECCPQWRAYHDESQKKDILWYNDFRRGEEFSYSEDCLNMNIYAPKHAKGCPVIVFIHGGSFTKGSNSEKPFDATQYARRGVVVAVINYRLNVFGFCVNKGSANLALRDMICAIEWVRDNIAVFGGDGENITLMGQSAGAMSVQCLILNPTVKEMVKGAVMISGGGAIKGVYAPHSLKWAKRFFDKFERKMSSFAKNANSKEVYLAYEECAKKYPISAMLACMPVFDSEIVDRCNYKNIGIQRQIPCIIGTTKDDMQPRGVLVRNAKGYGKKCSAPVWVYKFCHDLPGDDRGAWHSSDLWYVFGSFAHCWRNFGEADVQLSNRIIGYVCAFAHAQDPNEGGLPEWGKKDVCVLE